MSIQKRQLSPYKVLRGLFLILPVESIPERKERGVLFLNSRSLYPTASIGSRQRINNLPKNFLTLQEVLAVKRRQNHRNIDITVAVCPALRVRAVEDYPVDIMPLFLGPKTIQGFYGIEHWNLHPPLTPPVDGWEFKKNLPKSSMILTSV
jgi:hypothetical protein